jgi:hypothetical protein
MGFMVSKYRSFDVLAYGGTQIMAKRLIYVFYSTPMLKHSSSPTTKTLKHFDKHGFPLWFEIAQTIGKAIN